MELITIRSQILSVRKRWYKRYSKLIRQQDWDTESDYRKAMIYRELKKINLNMASAEDVAGIIGNDSWACAQTCDICHDSFDEVVIFCKDNDGVDMYTCEDCIYKAHRLFE